MKIGSFVKQKNVMKNLLMLLFFLFSVCTIFSQDKDQYSKLKELYGEKRYEDCAYKAETMTMKDKYSRDPEPYLYLAMCNYEISLLHYYKDLFLLCASAQAGQCFDHLQHA